MTSTRTTPCGNRIADSRFIGFKDIEVPDTDAEWPEYLEERLSENGYNPMCAYCVHMDCGAEKVEITGARTDEWFSVVLMCKALAHKCPDEPGYNAERAEWTEEQVRLEGELDSLESSELQGAFS